ncbi:MAG: hypothetical protein MJ054_02205 [Clostridia bacterium]|nr:hypothetical protein [Clostridia bacterium]
MAVFEITTLFLGSIIGAGFATGAEIITFFGNKSLPTWLIAIIAGLNMFIIISAEIFLHQPTKQNKNACHNPIESKPLYVVFVMIYLILFTAMTAGISQITNPLITLISLLLSIIFTLSGIQKMSHFNFYIVLIIIILLTTTALPHLPQIANTPLNTIKPHNITATVFWSLLYAGLNCFTFPELIQASAGNHKRKTIFFAGIITSCFISLLIFLILTTITSTHSETAPIPLLNSSPNHITFIVILLSVLTSQYTTLFAITQRTHVLLPKTKEKPLLTAVFICYFLF